MRDPKEDLHMWLDRGAVIFEDHSCDRVEDIQYSAWYALLDLGCPFVLALVAYL